MARKTKAEQERLKELAEHLYTSDTRITKKEVAEKVGVTQNTIAKWIDLGKWDEKRISLVTTKRAEITRLYKQFKDLQDYIETRTIIYDVPLSIMKPKRIVDADGSVTYEPAEYDEKDFPIKQNNFPSSSESSTLINLASAIKKLETETSIGQIIEVAKDFVDYVAQDDYDFSKTITKLMDGFINSKMQ